ncbi:hypothetical protein SETIT_7G185400v2 [Setaria italica]|uniref:Uncharacterized protein n=1 Tax=Setaria italica TaxID=4555 RepID=A0A368RX65_SETIT|nr:hypothetical protein SETIT_7G185400v2 [Setaria italica]
MSITTVIRIVQSREGVMRHSKRKAQGKNSTKHQSSHHEHQHAAAISAQKTQATERKKKVSLKAVQKGKAGVKVVPKRKRVISSDDDDDDDEEEEEEEEGTAAVMKTTTKKGESVDEDSDNDYSEIHTAGGDDDEPAIVKVRKFEGCSMLAEVDRTEDNGVASRTRRRKDSKGTFSDPVDV